MIRSPILKVLSTIQKHHVTCLLMGGQACVFYGAAEFSRDTDLALLAEPANLSRLQAALDELLAERIAVPPFDAKYLELGLSVHFRCHVAEADKMRIDVMSKMRGVAPFDELWRRRHSIEVDSTTIDLLALSDLVQAKKTQRDKDWPMIARLMEADYLAHQSVPGEERLRFWLRELRTPELLVSLSAANPDAAREVAAYRPLLTAAIAGDPEALRKSLRNEEESERDADRRYWLPLKGVLAQLRAAERQGGG